MYDVIVSDIRMPKVSGAELVKPLKRLKPDIRIILTSGFDTNYFELGEYQIERFIEKPILPSSLCDIIDKLLIQKKLAIRLITHDFNKFRLTRQQGF